jgi:hypothetical protein
VAILITPQSTPDIASATLVAIWVGASQSVCSTLLHADVFA